MTKDNTSYLAHNDQYVTHTLEYSRQIHENYTKTKHQYEPYNPLGEMLDAHGKRLKIGVDIGSGIGWASALMSTYFDKVYAIEPSEKAVETAKIICEDKKNIDWICGFAEEELKKITLDGPALFNTSCVFSHLQDATVIDICAQIDKMAKKGSVLSLAENHGAVYSDGKMWHSRSEAWWNERFPNWELVFRKAPGSHQDIFLAFHGIKGASKKKSINETEKWLAEWIDK